MKATLKLLFIAFAALSWYSSFACICGKEAREWSIETVNLNIERNDLIFIGEVIQTDGENYSFRVIDVFKGNIASDTIYGRGGGMGGSCSITPYIGGLWIVYTQLDEKGMMDLTFCNLSRSLTKLSQGMPPPGIELTEEKYNPSWSGKGLPEALQEWMQEYTILASLKKDKSVSVSQDKIATEERDENNSGHLNYVAVGLAIVALLVAIFKK